MPSTRPATEESLAPPPAAARRLDRDDVTRGKIASQLRAGRLTVDEIASGRTGGAPALPLRSIGAALADDRQAAVLEHAQLAHHARAALVLALAARAEAEPVALDA